MHRSGDGECSVVVLCGVVLLTHFCIIILGTVPYASLAYCKKWQQDKDSKLNVEVVEIEGAEHRDMMANKVVINAILDWVCEHPVCPITGKKL